MLRFLSLFLLINFQAVFVQCLIPGLSVRKLDKKLIERKRQDTLDMCRIFNAENQRLKDFEKSNFYTHDKNEHNVVKKRVKRDLGDLEFIVNPALNNEDLRRVENIVDKLYDDLEEKGEHIPYRQKNLQGSTGLLNDTLPSRRRDSDHFAPAKLMGPLPSDPVTPEHIPDETRPEVPWHKKWPNGIIPFFIDHKTYDSHLADTVLTAFNYFEKATCIRLQRLREKPTDKKSLQAVEWVYITNPSGIRQCVHSNERKMNKGVQMVVFGYDCMSLGEIVHEVMHVLGFSHEHTRPDRDQYVAMLWDNIKPGYKKYFERRISDVLLHLPYDYNSVLHYPPRAFSKNGQITVLAEAGFKVGQREGLSEIDVEKVHAVFGTECVERNKQYLLTTCPSVVKANTESKPPTKQEIVDYFKPRLWPYGIINYKLRDKMEFSAEERENIESVIRHIEKETCLEFRDLSEDENEDDNHDNIKKTDTKNTTALDENNVQAIEPANYNDDNLQEVINKDSAQKEEEDLKEHDHEDNQQIPENQTPKKLESINNNSKQTDENEITDVNSSERTKRAVYQSSKPKAQRRHASSILVLVRSTKPGCRCPKPGKPSGDTSLAIGADCFGSVNSLLHLFVHVLGLDHQHNMHDRDSYLHIVWDELSPEVKNEMERKLPPAASVGLPYDYQSVMHYPWLQIKNGVTNTMYPIWNDGWVMGHWQGLSSGDVQKLNHLYLDQCLERKKHENDGDPNK